MPASGAVLNPASSSARTGVRTAPTGRGGKTETRAEPSDPEGAGVLGETATLQPMV
eukprot:CAMPEP_0171288124 /NCGR_PEP_ID=MMETSP0790-20130122/69936_1 /TAXON_ID=2925 /ORGANISM="Alexandrium catenella, Strain OF101" /LENGTH=55 /DNA_ID=CAMNT_0011757729 /DNA_START=67 /DNA_END=230 /DNA_ORIENTATION=-